MLIFGCNEETADATVALEPASTTTAITEFSAQSFAEIDVQVIDGTLHFGSTVDVANVIELIGETDETELDAWTASIGFHSWGREHRAILDRIDEGSVSTRNEILTKDQTQRFYLRDDNTVMSRAHSRIMSELMDLDGVFYVNGNLNYLAGDSHILIGANSTSSLESVLADPTSNVEDFVRVENVLKEVSSDDNYKLVKYFPCPYSRTGVRVHGHRVERTLSVSSNPKKRLIYEITRSTYVFEFSDPSRPDRYFFNTAIDIINQERAGFIWRSTYPEFEYGTLIRGRNVSGRASSSLPDQQMRVDREINAGRTGGGSFFHNSRNAPYTEIGTSFEKKKKDNRHYENLDNLIVEGTGSGQLSSGRVRYRWRSGRITVNWLANNAVPMDIQLGCE